MSRVVSDSASLGSNPSPPATVFVAQQRFSLKFPTTRAANATSASPQHVLTPLLPGKRQMSKPSSHIASVSSAARASASCLFYQRGSVPAQAFVLSYRAAIRAKGE